jgi:hypothetical protein
MTKRAWALVGAALTGLILTMLSPVASATEFDPYEVDACWTMASTDEVEGTYQFPQTYGCLPPKCEEVVEYQYDTYTIRDEQDEALLADLIANGLDAPGGVPQDSPLEPHDYYSVVVYGDECQPEEPEEPETPEEPEGPEQPPLIHEPPAGQPPVTKTSPPVPTSVPSGLAVAPRGGTCTDASKTVDDVDKFAHFAADYDNRYAVRLDYRYCNTGSSTYHVLQGYRISVTMRDSKSCAFGDWDYYRINVHELGPTNPPTKEWPCVEGKGEYSTYHDLNGQVLTAGADDRCFAFNWKAVWTGHADKTGTSNSACLG